MPGPNIPKFLNAMNCFGAESSLFMCKNPGWKRGINEECNKPNKNAGVFCYNNGKNIQLLFLSESIL